LRFWRNLTKSKISLINKLEKVEICQIRLRSIARRGIYGKGPWT
jgi:hypothetical protein